jgi:hypothetical protein
MAQRSTNRSHHALLRPYIAVMFCLVALATALSSCTSVPTAAPTAGHEPQWGFPFRPGLTGNIGVPETNPNSRLHDSNYDRITDDTSGTVYTFGQGDGGDSASLDMGVYGGSIRSDDVSDENALALAPGKVLAVQKSCNAVLIDHQDGWWVIYLHLNADRIWVSKDDEVAAGTPIGVPTVSVSGCQQRSSFQHVHFAFLHNGKFVTMRNRLLCGHAVLDNGIEGVDLLPSLTAPVPVSSNFIFAVPATCPAERSMTNAIATTGSAGYRILRGGVTGVRAQWDMPHLTGPSNAAMNVGINVGCWQGNINVDPPACIGVSIVGEILTDGSTRYRAVEESGGSAKFMSVPIAAGNHMTASITLADSDSHTWTLTLANTTQGASDQSLAQYEPVDTYPTFDIGPGFPRNSGIATFSDVPYTNAQVRIVHGAWVDASALPYQRTEMHINDVTGKLVARASTMSNSAFTVSYVDPGV